jgi:hypothetical protein
VRESCGQVNNPPGFLQILGQCPGFLFFEGPGYYIIIYTLAWVTLQCSFSFIQLPLQGTIGSEACVLNLRTQAAPSPSLDKRMRNFLKSLPRAHFMEILLPYFQQRVKDTAFNSFNGGTVARLTRALQGTF